MKELFERGAILDLALAVVALEVVLLVALAKRPRARLGVVDALGQVLAGVLLMLALRSAVTGGDWRVTLFFVTASFPAHVFDLVRRFSAPRSAGS